MPDGLHCEGRDGLGGLAQVHDNNDVKCVLYTNVQFSDLLG